jgi:ParB family transcriptional regulator, chromosome partitioning protein
MARLIPVDRVKPNPQQPRQVFDREKLEGLSKTIKRHGVIQPIVVYADGDFFVLLDGERRWQAAMMAGKTRIRAEIRRKPVDGKQPGGADRSRLEQALIANLQKEEMGPVEEGLAFLKLVEGFKLTQKEIAARLGINVVRVGNSIMFARADPEIRDLVSKGKLYQNAELVRALMDISDREVRIQMATDLASQKNGLKASLKAVHMATEACNVGASDKAPAMPAMDYVAQKYKVSGKPPKWDVLKQLGKVPEWELVVMAAEQTCKKCSLSDIASSDSCCQCPAVDFLGLMMKEAK